MNLIKNPKVVLSFLFLLSLLMHFPVFKSDLIGYHSWRQTLTQINIENFAFEDFNILNPKTNDRGNGNGIMRLEFPLMQWLFACFYKLSGNHLIITRILSFAIGIFSVLGIYFLLKNIFRKEILAIAGAWAFNFSPVFYYYTMNPLPDNFALCCSIWGLSNFFGWTIEKTRIKIILAGMFLSLGALAKLPFILYYIVPFAYLFIERESIKIKYFPLILLLFSVFPIIVWYSFSVPNLRWNPVLFGIFNETDLPVMEQLDSIRYIVISTLPELLINYGSLLFFLSGIYVLFRKKLYLQKSFYVFLSLSIVLALYYFYEMNAIGKVHDYYLFPFLPPIFIIVAYGAFHLNSHRNNLIKKLSFLLLMALPVLAFLRINSRWNEAKPGFNKNLLIFKKELKNTVPDSSLCIVGNDESHNIWYYYLQKKGWAFDKDNLSPDVLKNLISKGARYLYCDSRKVDENPEITFFLDSLIMEKEDIRVFSLKDKFNTDF